jgi:hypothetical protein
MRLKITLRREGDSNPRSTYRRTTVFETAAFDRSAISPYCKNNKLIGS